MKTLNTKIGLNVAGVPQNSVFAQKIMAACSQDTTSSTAIDAVYSYLFGINKILSEAAQGTISWLPSTTINKNYPVQFIQEGMGENVNSVSLYLIPLESVINGNEPPVSYTETDDKSYYKVAKTEMIVNVSSKIAYAIEMNVGVSTEAIQPSEFNTVDWEATFENVLPQLVQELNRLFGSSDSNTSNSGNNTNSLSNGAISSISSEVDSSMLFILGLQATKTAIEHYSYFRTLIANFTNENLLFNDVYTHAADDVEYYNTLGLSNENIQGNLLKSPETLQCISTNDSYQLVQMINMNVKSAKKLRGVGISYQYQTNNQKNFSSLIDVPFSRDNKINTQADYSGSAQDFWKNGGDTVTFKKSEDSSTSIQSAISIDYLSGKHPSTNGEMAYFYSSINSFTNN